MQVGWLSELMYPQRFIIEGMVRGAQGGVYVGEAELCAHPRPPTLPEIDSW